MWRSIGLKASLVIVVVSLCATLLIVNVEGAFVDWPSPTTSLLYSVYMVSGSDGWAVGEAGTIIRWDGTGWITAASPTTQNLHSVLMVSDSDGWAVGIGGTIIHWDGTEWSTVTSPTTSSLQSVYMVSGSDGWAVGSYGTIIRYVPAPEAAFTYSPPEPKVGEAVSFDASGSFDPHGTIVSYAWDFGDENTGTGETTSHAYSAADTYTVTLTVTDDDGLEDEFALLVTVQGEPSPGIATIIGRVVDEDTGVPLVGAIVTCGSYNTSTEQDGMFSLNVTAGTYTLKVSKEGYETKTITITATEGGTYPPDVELEASTPPPAPGLAIPMEFLAAGIVVAVVAAVVAAVLIYLKWFKRKEKAPKPSSIRITAEPTELLADGESKSTINLELLDKEGKLIPAPEDIKVKLSSTAGKIKSPVLLPKGKAAEKTFLISSKDFGTVKVSADAKGLESIGVTLKFSEKKRYCMCCGAKMSLDAKRCPKCNEPPPSARDTFNCKNCGELLPLSVKVKFCRECGAGQPNR